MEGWVYLVDLIAPRLGVEPATFRSWVQRPTTAPPRQLLWGIGIVANLYCDAKIKIRTSVFGDLSETIRTILRIPHVFRQWVANSGTSYRKARAGYAMTTTTVGRRHQIGPNFSTEVVTFYPDRFKKSTITCDQSSIKVIGYLSRTISSHCMELKNAPCSVTPAYDWPERTG